jgi:hypothetical protein
MTSPSVCRMDIVDYEMNITILPEPPSKEDFSIYFYTYLINAILT